MHNPLETVSSRRSEDVPGARTSAISRNAHMRSAGAGAPEMRVRGPGPPSAPAARARPDRAPRRGRGRRFLPCARDPTARESPGESERERSPTHWNLDLRTHTHSSYATRHTPHASRHPRESGEREKTERHPIGEFPPYKLHKFGSQNHLYVRATEHTARPHTHAHTPRFIVLSGLPPPQGKDNARS